MTRRHELEDRLAGLETEYGTGDPLEITITDRVVDTDHPDTPEEGDVVRRTRIWRDEAGEWHSDRVDLTDAGDVDGAAGDAEGEW